MRHVSAKYVRLDFRFCPNFFVFDTPHLNTCEHFYLKQAYVMLPVTSAATRTYIIIPNIEAEFSPETSEYTMQCVSETLGKSSRSSFSHQHKEKRLYNRMYGNYWFLSLIQQWVLRLCNILLTTDIIRLQWAFVIKLLLSSCLLIEAQFATNAQNVLHMNQYAYGHFWSRTVELFQRSRYSCQSLTGTEVRWWSDFIFQLELNTQRIVSMPTGRNLKDWSRANLGVVRRISFADMQWYELFVFFRFGGEIIRELCAL
jgi:hypothetical protein